MTEEHWYNIEHVDQLDSPALVVYPKRVKQNIDMLKYMIDDVFRLRPHIKTFKNKEVALLMMDAGITKFKCATIAEAEMLGMCNAPDVLLAYQPIGPKLFRFIKLIQAYPDTKFSCLVDNEASANDVSAIAIENSLSVNVYIDLNVGMNRTGISLGEEVFKLYKSCFQLPGINLIGLHAYDGHIHDADIAARTEKANAWYEVVIKLQDEILMAGYPKPVIVAGGSPTFPIHAAKKNIECSPGTFVYWDRGYQLAFEEQNFLIAALLLTRIISLPQGNLLCIDCGHKSVAAENVLTKRIYFLNAPDMKIISQSEEHLVVDAGEGHNYKIGDVLYGVPYHICPTVALYECAITIENNNITGQWLNIARDRKITI
jgi:D-serine deaminase-like pyridoxal phosphate-dependent protein